MSKCVVERVPWVAKKSQKPSSSDTAQEESPAKIRAEETLDAKVAALIAAHNKKTFTKVKTDTSKKQTSKSTNKTQKASNPASRPVVEPAQVNVKSKKRPLQSIKIEHATIEVSDSDSEDEEEIEEDEEEESSESSESDDIHSTTNTSNTAWRNKDGDMYYELSAKHRCTVQSYLGQAYIDLREYKLNDNTGAMYPTTKGIKLTQNDWNTFLLCIPNLSKALKDLPPQSAEIVESQKAKAQKKWANSQKKSKKAKYSKD